MKEYVSTHNHIESLNYELDQLILKKSAGVNNLSWDFSKEDLAPIKPMSENESIAIFKLSSIGYGSPFQNEPDFINEIGVKWWLDKATTKYAKSADSIGVTLDVVCFFIEETNGRRSRVLVSKDKGAIYENQNLEALLSKIDILKFAMNPNNNF